MARLFTKASSEKIVPSAARLWTTSVSFSCWFKNASTPAGYPNRFTSFGLVGSSGVFINFLVQQNGSAIEFTYTTSSSTYVVLSFAATPDTGVWHHLGFSSDGTSAGTLMFLDGVSKSVSISGTPGTPSTTFVTDFRVGIFYNSADNDIFDGSLADLAMWKHQRLSAAELIALSTGKRAANFRPQSLTAYYPFDKNSLFSMDQSLFKTSGTPTGTVFTPDPPRLERVKEPLLMPPWLATKAAATAGFAHSYGTSF